MKMPRVSVIIPTHNRPALLVRAIESVRRQTFDDWEILVIDDGQTEPAETRVRELNEGRVRYLSNERRMGGSASRNRGIRESRGELLAFLDDDDVWLPEKLRTEVEALDQAGRQAGFCFCGVINVSDQGEAAVSVPEGEGDYHELALTRFKGFLTSTLLVRRGVMDEAGFFDESFPSHQEAELMIRITSKARGIGINKPLVRMSMESSHEHVGSSLDRRINGRAKLIAKHMAEYLARPKLLAVQYFRLALLFRRKGDWVSAWKYFAKSYALKKSPRVFLHGLVAAVPAVLGLAKELVLSSLRPKHFGTLLRGQYFKMYFGRPPLSRVRPRRVLDAGCGRGQYTRLLAEWFPKAEIVGADIFVDPAWAAPHPGNIQFWQVNLENFHEPRAWDLVVTIDTLEHIRENDRVMRNIADSIAPGGFLYMAVPCEDTELKILPRSWFGKFNEWAKDEHIGRQYRLSEWRSIIAETGMKIERARYTFTLWGIIGWEMEILLRGSRFGDRLNLVMMPVYRILCFLDRHIPIGKGDNLIIARRP